MRTLLVGNTGYITNKFVEEAFPESLVMVMGAVSYTHLTLPTN